MGQMLRFALHYCTDEIPTLADKPVVAVGFGLLFDFGYTHVFGQVFIVIEWVKGGL